MFRLLTVMVDINIYAMQVDADRVRQESVLGESSHDLRQMPGHVHRNIKDVVIIGFCSAKSMPYA
jgi:hypothetical protein